MCFLNLTFEDGSMCVVNFEDVSIINNYKYGSGAEITMKSGYKVAVRETPEEIMESFYELFAEPEEETDLSAN